MRKTLMTLLAALLAIAVLAPVASATIASSTVGITVEKGDYDSYVVVMKAEPLLASYEQSELRSSRANTDRAALEASHDRVMRDAGVDGNKRVNDYTNAANGFSALITHEEAERLAADKDVLLVMPDTLRQKTTDNTPDFLGLTDRQGAWATGYTGEDVVVGIIDTGIWPEHPSFADDGSYSDLGIVLDESVQSACDFGNSGHNAADVAFDCNDKLIGARQMLATYRALIGAGPDEFDSARDEDGHGTHTGSTSAGNADVEASIFGADLGTVSGIAPRARVIAYKGLGELGGFGSDLASAIDQAVVDGVDVINYSVGGGASLLGPDDIAYLFAADAGVYVATSAGNSGPGADTIGGPASVPWLTTVAASTQDRVFDGIAILGDGSEYGGASVTPGVGPLQVVDAEDFGNALCDPAVGFDGDVSGTIVLCLRGATARVAKSQAVADAGGAGMILYNFTDNDNLFTDTHYVPSTHINFTDGSAVAAYIDAEGAGATATIVTGTTSTQDAPSIAYFSSRGPNGVAEDIIKPDVTAPGVSILAGASPVASSGSPGDLFQAISGTSMSSPHVAGLFALLKQAHPDWSPAAAKSALMTTSYQQVVKDDHVTPADPFDMGAGHVDPSGRAIGRNSIFNPGLVYDAGFLDYLGFLCDAAPEAFADPAATCASLDASGIPTDASDLNLPSIGIADLAGSQTVQRTVTNVGPGRMVFRASVDAPSGFDVTVSPNRIIVPRGGSATYEVTITNVGAPLNTWKFGSISLQSRGYSVYSPIAVKATAFSAPSGVTGEGVDGSAEFDVTFGYAGDYTAAAHGLETAVVTTGNVVQDPDQTFDPADGFSNAHEFTTSGAAFVRFAMPPDAVATTDHDIDLFLYNSAGTLVATSTNGGTDEVIDIALPADDTWTLYVHGWQTVDASADYTLYAWIVSATPGGNMTVDSAPASAVLGAVETIGVSWTGATDGEWHLGAVSHADAAGLLGLTLVEVDNR